MQQDVLAHRRRVESASAKVPQASESTTSAESSAAGRLAWWHRIAAPSAGEVPPGARFRERELIRRGRLASTLLLGILCVWLASTPVGILTSSHGHIYIVFLIGLVVVGAAIWLNRSGLVWAAGLVLIFMLDAGFVALARDNGGSSVAIAGTTAVLINGVLIAAALLPTAGIFFIALSNCFLMTGTLLFQPGATHQMGQSAVVYTALIEPYTLQIVAALVSFVWARSMLNALRRADRAEASAQQAHQTEAARRAMLEGGAQQMRDVLVRMSNGDFHARVPMLPDPVLWYIGSSLNNFITRLLRLENSEYMLQREHHEAQMLAQAIRASHSGRMTVWPVPSGLPLDPVIAALKDGGGLSGPSGPIGPLGPSASSELSGTFGQPSQSAPSGQFAGGGAAGSDGLFGPGGIFGPNARGRQHFPG